MPDSHFIPFIVMAALVELTPGPNMGYLVINSALYGWRAGIMVTLGVALGLALLGGAVALGMGDAVTSHPALALMLRWLGVAYMVWLAWDTWRGQGLDGKTQHARFFERGLITNLLNPKAAVFFVAVLPSFLGADAVMPTSALLLTGIYVVIATLIHATLSFAGAQAQHWLVQNNRERSVRRIFAVMLVGIAGWIALATK